MSAALDQPHEITRYQLAVLIHRIRLAQTFGQRCTAELRTAREVWGCSGRTADRILRQLQATQADIDADAEAGQLAPELLRAMFANYTPQQLARYFDPELPETDLALIAEKVGVPAPDIHAAWHEAGRVRYGWRS